MKRPKKVTLEVTPEAAEALDDLSRRCCAAYNVLVQVATRWREQAARLRAYAEQLNERAKRRGTRIRLFLSALAGNWEERSHAFFRQLTSTYGLKNECIRLKDDPQHAWLGLIFGHVLQAVALRLTASVKAWNDGRLGRRPDRPGFPREQRWSNHWFSILWAGAWDGYGLENQLIEVTKPGRTTRGVSRPARTVRQHRWLLHLKLGPTELPSAARRRPPQRELTVMLAEALPKRARQVGPTSLRITKEHGRYEAVFMIEDQERPRKPIRKVLAIDPHHLQLLTAIDLEGNVLTVPQPDWLPRIDEGIDQLKSRRDHRHKREHRVELEGDRHYFRPSRGWSYLNERVQDELGRLERRKHHFLWSLGNWLFRQYDAVIIGDYAPKGEEIPAVLARRKLFNHSLLARLRQVLQSLAQRSGKTCVVLEETDTSRTCHDCGFQLPEPMEPSRQDWQCPQCLAEHQRHVNAARNLLRRGVQALNVELQAGLHVPSLVPIGTFRHITFDHRQVVVLSGAPL